MKQKKHIFNRAAGILLLLLSACILSCSSELVPTPVQEKLEGSTSGSASKNLSAPRDVTATLGLKRRISLNWTTVNKAVRYYVYAATTPFESYVKVGETTSHSYDYAAQAGTTRYFKVTAVSFSDEESDVSTVVKGSTLAQPVISDIQQTEGKEDSSVTVYWYMENSSGYSSTLRYTITCLNGSAVVAAGTLDGTGNDGKETDTAYTFSNLKQNTNYKYTVEAYLISAQTDSETSEAVDAATAVSLRPKAPLSLTAAEGTAKNTITLSFRLPEEAYSKQTAGTGTSDSKTTYVQYPLYFRIYRRAAAAGETENSWETLENNVYYSAAVTSGYTTTAPSSAGAYDYAADAVITYTDTSSITRGVQYEYKVQSYVFEKNTTSNLSAVSAIGWAAAVPSIKTCNVTYTTVQGSGSSVVKTKASVAFTAAWNSFGKAGSYKFVLKSNRTKINASDADDSVAYKVFPTVDELNRYTAEYDLQNSAATARGYYTYTLYIVDPGVTDATAGSYTAGALDSVTAAGTLLITDEISLPTFAGFTLTGGYKNKVTVSWTKEADSGNVPYSYTLNRYTLDANGNQTGEVVTIPTDLSSTAINSTYTCTDTTAISGGTAYSYTLYAATAGGLKVPSDTLTAYTLGTPAVQFNESAPAYDEITAAWSPVPEAVSYTVTLNNGTSDVSTGKITKTTAADGTAAYSVTANNADSTVTVNTSGQIVYRIAEPAGCDNAQFSGTDMTLTVTAESSIHDTTAGTAVVRTLGPAQTAAAASLAASASKITVTWKSVAGAAGYLVRRDRCDTANASISSTDVYLVPAAPTGAANEVKANRENVSAVTADISSGILTLTDTYAQKPAGIVTTWQDNQDKLAWGYPYRYYVFPLHSLDDTYETDTAYQKIQNVTYKNIARIYSAGCTLGYGFSVTATKAVSPSSVTVTWEKPYSGTADPKLWRKRADGAAGASWELTSENVDVNKNFVVTPSGEERIIPYYYAVSYSSETPHDSYLDFITSAADTLSPTEPLNKGYAFAVDCKAANIKNGAAAGYGERISWTTWDYATRAVGPARDAVYTVYLKNSDYGPDWNKLCTIAQKTGGVTLSNDSAYAVQMAVSAASLSLQPVFTHDTHSGLLQVLRDYKHYVKMELTRTLPDGSSITAAYADGDLFAFREITPKEFALETALAVATALYTDRANNTSTYMDYDKSGTWGTRRIFYFNKDKGPFFQTVTGTLYAYAGATTIEAPTIYGAYDYSNWGSLGSGGEARASTLTTAGPYNGSVTITSMASGSGTYQVAYGTSSSADFRAYVTPLFSFGGSFSSPGNRDWSAEADTWK